MSAAPLVASYSSFDHSHPNTSRRYYAGYIPQVSDAGLRALSGLTALTELNLDSAHEDKTK
eukprot:521473-Prorocentrum_minimum.AAC.1